MTCAPVVVLTLAGCGGTSTNAPAAHIASRDQAIRTAHTLYRRWVAAKKPVAAGPCISNGGNIPGWVVDIAHQPRESVDDDPKNQCPAFVNGKVNLFVELDPQGHLIRTGP